MRKLILITLIIFWRCIATASQISVIPKPVEFENKSSFFRLTDDTVILYSQNNSDEARYDRWKECPHCKKKMQKEGLKDFHELQSYMTRQMEKYLMSKGRCLIGWDEILNGGLAPNATVMTWHRPVTAVKAAKSGNNVVMALTSYAYFDTPESKLPGESPAATWLPPISLRKAYEWEPAPPALNEQEKKFILGGHGCLWTDRFMHNPILQDMSVLNENRSFRYVEYLSLPRMAALGEVVWTPQSLRNWKDFQKRAGRHYNRYSACKYNYRVPQPIVHKPVKSAGKNTVTVTCPINGAKILYTIDGSNPTIHSSIYTDPVTIDELYKFRAITVVSERHFSLPFAFEEDSSKKYTKYVIQIGEWKTGEVSAGVYRAVEFDVTGRINGKGTYEVTFIYTHGAERLDIEKAELIVNNEVVTNDVHHGFTGGQQKDNQYRLEVEDYETGATYFLRANVMGDVGSDSNGIVLMKKIK